ncbi:MAG: Lrp/AsnC ligand binding domain-containing protein [candidate division WOR-3 bacterium]|uniref:Lrp/AsnC family transcriptional regulator n=1 Tax=candidate division WOR-3 bacterium TaxID=2052148 RepID=A0A7C4WF11_UNCW3
MKRTAFILINCLPGKTKEVLNKLLQIPNVQYAEMVLGPYDIIAIIQATEIETIAVIVDEKIRTIDGVDETITCVAIGKEDITGLIF